MGEIHRGNGGKSGSRWPPGPLSQHGQTTMPHSASATAGWLGDWPPQRCGGGGQRAHAWPSESPACRALHALLGGASWKLPTLVSCPPGEPHCTIPKIRWAPLLASGPQPRQSWSGIGVRHGARAADTHHVGGVRREGRRPAQPCACVEGRPAPVVNESPTWAPIGWDVRTYAHTWSLGKHGGVCGRAAMLSWLRFVCLA